MPVDYVAWHSVRCPLLSSHLPSMFLHRVKLSFDGQRNFISESSQKVLLAHRLCVSSWGILVHSGPRHATLLPTSIGNGEIAVPKYSTPCVCGLSLSVQDVSCRVSFFFCICGPTRFTSFFSSCHHCASEEFAAWGNMTADG